MERRRGAAETCGPERADYLGRATTSLGKFGRTTTCKPEVHPIEANQHEIKVKTLRTDKDGQADVAT